MSTCNVFYLICNLVVNSYVLTLSQTLQFSVNTQLWYQSSCIVIRKLWLVSHSTMPYMETLQQENFHGFTVFHSIVNLFLWVMILLIFNISLQNATAKDLTWIAISDSKSESFTCGCFAIYSVWLAIYINEGKYIHTTNTHAFTFHSTHPYIYHFDTLDQRDSPLYICHINLWSGIYPDISLTTKPLMPRQFKVLKSLANL